jgi:hypothetical protein
MILNKNFILIGINDKIGSVLSRAIAMTGKARP